MVGFLVVGALSALLAAELYYILKVEEKEESDHKCNCGCCHKEENEEEE